MRNERPILVAHDLTTVSDGAWARAKALSQARGCPLVLVHALDFGGLPQGTGELYHALERGARNRVDEIAAEAKAEDVSLTTVVKRGRAAAVLAREAKRYDAQLVVIGTHVWEPLADLVLGSTTRRLLQRSTVPVLVARGASRLPWRKALALTDFSEASVGAIYALIEQLPPGAELHILHAWGLSDYPVPIPEMGLVGDGLGALERIANRQLLDFVADIRAPGIKLLPRVVPGPAPSAARDACAEENYDVVALGSRGRGRIAVTLLGSVTDRFLQLADRDVLVAPVR